MAPSGLYARLCHAFLVANFLLILTVKQVRKLVNIKLRHTKIVPIFGATLYNCVRGAVHNSFDTFVIFSFHGRLETVFDANKLMSHY